VVGIYKWSWKSCLLRTIFCAWLLLSDRLNTRDMLQRRHWEVTNETHCVLCPSRTNEDRMHLFFSAISVRESGTIYRLTQG
jgi:hypothetical protein